MTIAFMPVLPLAAALSDYPAFTDSLVYQLNGLVVVFTALSLIWLMLEILGLFFKRTAAPVAVIPAAPVAPVLAHDDLPAEWVAAIAAAVHVTLGANHRIATIVPVDAPAQDWAREGRRQIHSARKVR